LSRRIDKTIRTNADASPTQRGIVVHGNRFISHCIFRRIGKSSDLDASDIIKDEVVEDAVMRVLSGVSKIIDKDYADAYLAPLFKNVKKCTDIRFKLEKA
jgi:hypothetical protein